MSGTEVPVPANQVTMMEVAYYGAIDTGDIEWLRSIGTKLFHSIYTDFVNAVSAGNPTARVGTSFANSVEEAIRASTERAAKSNQTIMYQPKSFKLTHPSKGPTDYDFLLNIYLVPASSGPVIFLIAPSHCIVSKL